jgi:uncharacterized protein
LLAGVVRSAARDWQWWLALACGPLFWIALWSVGHALADLRWPFAQPLVFAQLALLMPVLEELAFRGLLQTWLLQRAWGRRRIAGVSAANALTSLAFALAHLWRHAPAWAAAVFVPSLAFGYFRERHDSVLPAMVLHAVYNAGYFWLFAAPR